MTETNPHVNERLLLGSVVQRVVTELCMGSLLEVQGYSTIPVIGNLCYRCRCVYRYIYISIYIYIHIYTYIDMALVMTSDT